MVLFIIMRRYCVDCYTSMQLLSLERYESGRLFGKGRVRPPLLLLAEECLVLLLCLDESLLEQIGVLRVGETDSERLGLWLTLGHIGSGVPHPAAVAANVWRELHVRND